MTAQPSPAPADALSAADLADAWQVLSADERAEALVLLPRAEAEDFFLTLPSRDQAHFVLSLAAAERRAWVRLLPPDDVADLVQAAPADDREPLIALLDEPTRREVTVLLAYAEDRAGGLMSTRYARVRPDMTVDEALGYLRRQARDRVETIYYAYVLDAGQHLMGVVSFRDLFAAAPGRPVHEIMERDVIRVTDDTDQEAVSRLFQQHDLVAVPVVDQEGRMKGIVTFDDIVDVVEEEATEDIQKMGGTSALHEPYLDIGFFRMIQKRGGWLTLLFMSEMLTATAMGFFESEIRHVVALALFIPLIISSGGNSGSQASTLVIRAMAVGEVKARDWWRVVRRELLAGIVLGCMLGSIGFLRIVVWPNHERLYTAHFVLVALTVSCSLVGVVTWGTLAGSTLPFVLRRFGLDPATASAPFVATLIDVSGLVIYFSTASVVLRGTLL